MTIKNTEHNARNSQTARSLHDRRGPPDKVGLSEKHQWEKQERFLLAFRECGTVLHAALRADIGRTMVYNWNETDAQGFKERWDHARHAYREKWEALMDERLADPQGNRGSDILLMFKLKALYPERYRETITLVDDTAKDLLKRLRVGGAATVTVKAKELPEGKDHHRGTRARG